MLTYLDAKAMAKTLRAELTARKTDITHAQSLEIVARLFGQRDWNTLSALIDRPAASTAPLRLPEGWIVGGDRPESYELGAEPNTAGVAIIRLKLGAAIPDAGGFATLMQSISAADWRGSRIRLSAELKADNVEGAVTLWMRIEGDGGQIVRFDNMERRTENGVLTGTTGWLRRDIVLDVPEEATSIHFGFYLRGGGTARARNFGLDKVGADVPSTTGGTRFKPGPTNLGLS